MFCIEATFLTPGKTIEVQERLLCYREDLMILLYYTAGFLFDSQDLSFYRSTGVFFEDGGERSYHGGSFRCVLSGRLVVLWLGVKKDENRMGRCASIENCVSSCSGEIILPQS